MFHPPAWWDFFSFALGAAWQVGTTLSKVQLVYGLEIKTGLQRHPIHCAGRALHRNIEIYFCLTKAVRCGACEFFARHNEHLPFSDAQLCVFKGERLCPIVAIQQAIFFSGNKKIPA